MLDPAQFTLSTIKFLFLLFEQNPSRQDSKKGVCVQAAMTSAQLFIRLGADLTESSVGGWQIPDGPDQMVAAVYSYRAKQTFWFHPQMLLIDYPAKWQQYHWCFYDNKIFWSMWLKSPKPAGLVLLQWCHLVSYNCCRQQSDKDAKAHASASHGYDWSLGSNPWVSHRER